MFSLEAARNVSSWPDADHSGTRMVFAHLVHAERLEIAAIQSVPRRLAQGRLFRCKRLHGYSWECPLWVKSGHWEVITLDKVCKKKDAGQLRPASLTRRCAQGDGHARGEGTPRGMSERSEASA